MSREFFNPGLAIHTGTFATSAEKPEQPKVFLYCII